MTSYLTSAGKWEDRVTLLWANEYFFQTGATVSCKALPMMLRRTWATVWCRCFESSMSVFAQFVGNNKPISTTSLELGLAGATAPMSDAAAIGIVIAIVDMFFTSDQTV
jgi:hypothetical protein